jgi:hypothetical protein
LWITISPEFAGKARPCFLDLRQAEPRNSSRWEAALQCLAELAFFSIQTDVICYSPSFFETGEGIEG